MTNLDLATSLLFKATKRLKVLDVLLAENDHSDVIRESQEIVELALKAMLRRAGVDPPRRHDVGATLREHAARFSEDVRADLERCAEISALLVKEREQAFYGDIDFIPTEEYTREDSTRAMAEARFVVATAARAASKETAGP